MHDILFRIPFFHGHELPVHSYGVMAMLGFLAGILVARWRARRVGLSPDLITDVCIWALLAGIVGSRIAYILTYPQEFHSLGDIIAIWRGGLVFYGGFIGAAIVVLLFLRARKQALLQVLDVLTPSLALGHAFGRLGCFLRGCCYGQTVHPGAWYGVVYPVPSDLNESIPYNPHTLHPVPPGTPLFPSQLLESFNLLVIFTLLSLYFRHRRGVGEVAGLYFVLYSLQRFIGEFFRGDTRLPGELSQAQWISIVTFFAGLCLYAFARGGGTRRANRG